jgi:hypothetical protein
MGRREGLFSRNPPENKSQKSGVFFAGQFGVTFHHVFTTDSPRFTIQKPRKIHPISQTPPQKHAPPPQKKKTKKKTPKPFCGSGVIGLQTARKPNSVLDDHSSTRRITAAL